MTPCYICGEDKPTDTAWHDKPLCADCKVDLLINCVPGETPILARIDARAKHLTELRRQVGKL